MKEGFEGNAQSFRIVTRLSIRTSRTPGLNLTRATLNAVLKYPWMRGESTPGKEAKFGYYDDDADAFEFARELEGAASKKQSLEAAVMDYADDVAYSVHDLDDFYRARLIPLDALFDETDERHEFLESLAPAARSWAALFLHRLGFIAGPELRRPFKGTRAQIAALNEFSSNALRRYLLTESPETIRVTSRGANRLIVDKELRREIDLLKSLTRYYIFDNPALSAQQEGQRLMIRHLFTVLFEAAEERGQAIRILPAPLREALSSPAEGIEPRNWRARTVADFLCTITEYQAGVLQKRVTGFSPGTILDPIVW